DAGPSGPSRAAGTSAATVSAAPGATGGTGTTGTAGTRAEPSCTETPHGSSDRVTASVATTRADRADRKGSAANSPAGERSGAPPPRVGHAAGPVTPAAPRSPRERRPPGPRTPSNPDAPRHAGPTSRIATARPSWYTRTPDSVSSPSNRCRTPGPRRGAGWTD